MTRLVVALSAVLALALPASAEVPADLAEVRQMVETLAPQITQAPNDWMRALTLRNLVHGHSAQNLALPLASTADLRRHVTVFRQSLVTRERTNACQGMAILYLIALRAYDLDARMVQLFSSRTAARPVWSHASVDAWIDDAWVAMDPTTNVSLRGGAGELLSWQDAITRAATGLVVIPQPDGQLAKPSQSWGAVTALNGYRLEDWAGQTVLGLSRRSTVEIVGDGWDGHIEFLDGQVYDARAAAESAFYRDLLHAETPGGP